MEENPDQLRGRTVPWGRGASFVLAALVLFGLWLRWRGLSAEGFGDDEVHKWLAANRYLQGVFSGDDVEHPMLMKWLIAASIAPGSRPGVATQADAGAPRRRARRIGAGGRPACPPLVRAHGRPALGGADGVLGHARRVPAGGEGRHPPRALPHAPALVHGGSESGGG